MDEQLQQAAQHGNINILYELLRNEPPILERIDAPPYADTALHVSATAGHTLFAMEVATLRPSLARKLNLSGWSPMHLALERRHTLDPQNSQHLALRNRRDKTVRALMTVDVDLIRVKGRGRVTPLHYAAQIGVDELLAEFLSACPSSIEDLTSKCETAVHVAMKNCKLSSVKVLVGWLMRVKMEEILNWNDEDGNTVLHIATFWNQPERLAELLGNWPERLAELVGNRPELRNELLMNRPEQLAELLRNRPELRAELLRNRPELRAELLRKWPELRAELLENRPERLTELLRNRPDLCAALLENLPERRAELLENWPELRAELRAELLGNWPELRAELLRSWPKLCDVLLEDQREVIKLLIGRLNVNAKNFDDFTALDLYERSQHHNKEEVGNILRSANAKNASSLSGVTSLADHLSQKAAFSELLDRFLNVLGNGSNTKSPRDMILVVAGLVVAATYQAVLSPPGGYWQDNDFPSTNNSTATAGSEGGPHSAGEMIMSGTPLYLFLGYNTVAFLTSACTILIILLGLPSTLMLRLSVYFLLMNYYTSLISSFPSVTLRGAYPFVAILGYILVAAGFWVPEYMFSQREKRHLLINTPMRRLGNSVIG